MHISASAARSLLYFNLEKITSALKNYTKMIILITHMYGDIKFSGKCIIEIQILV